MSERILEALVQLFAVVASVRGAQDMSERRMIVYNFLAGQLNNELANRYISKFDDHYRNSIELGRRSDNQYKIISRVSSKVMRITYEMNRELSQYQKYIVLVQLYEYLNTGQISFVERGLVHDVVADKFNIKKDEFELIRNFILTTDQVNDRVVFSGDENCEDITEPKHVFWEDLGGELHFIYLPGVNFFLFKYTGERELEMNGALVRNWHTYIMRAGNSLRNGVSAPIFYNDMLRYVDSLNSQTPITFEARNVVYNFTKDLIGLQKFSFESHSGRLVGIMGVSGSGKSTICNVISGMAAPSSGNVYINNIDIYKNPEAIKGLIGYVSQDDILIEDLTVYENLYYNARMSFDNLPHEVMVDRIETILHLLGLYEIKDIKVGSPLNKKISGGQRKRLNIALELIREPAILILDEPTSGLSSHDSENLVELLKDLTIKGKLIFVVIHQPSSEIFKMFDQLLILDTGGYLIYDGNPIESLNYFRLSMHMLSSKDVECRRCGNVNVEQILNLISMPIVDEYGNTTQMRKVSPKEWYEKFNWGALDISYVGDPEPLPEITFKTPNRLKQIFIYFSRDVKAKMANLQYLLINLLETPLLALLLATLLRYFNISAGDDYVYSDNPNMPVYIIISVIVAFFIGLTVSAEEIIQDRPLLKRELFLNLSRWSYIVSKCSWTLILSAIQMFIFVIVGNSILDIRGMTLEYWLVLFSTAVSANLLGLNLSDCMKKTINIYIIIPFMVIPQLILSGVFVKFDKMNPDFSSATGVPAYGQIIVARWAFEALAVNQFIYNEYEGIFYPYHKAKSQATYYKDYWVPELQATLNKVAKYVDEDRADDKDEAQRLLDIVHNEIYHPMNSFAGLEPPTGYAFAVGLYGNALYDAVMDYLNDVRRYNVQRYNKADASEEQQRRSMNREQLDYLRLHYYNRGIEEFICSRNGGFIADMIAQYDGRLWQKADIVFTDTDSSLGAPLFSPYKNFLGTRIDTYIFDILVIWCINLFLFLLLLSGLPAKLFR